MGSGESPRVPDSSHPFAYPRGSIYTTIMELGIERPSLLWLWGPNSIMVVYMDPLGTICNVICVRVCLSQYMYRITCIKSECFLNTKSGLCICIHLIHVSCIHTYIHARRMHIHIYTYRHIHICIFTSIHLYICTYHEVCVYIHIICVYIYIYVYLHVYIKVYVYVAYMSTCM